MTEAFYVHAIVSTRTPLPAGLSGVSGAPIRAISYRGLSAWGCSIEEARPSPTADNLVAHEVAVEEIRSIDRALPVRFGTVLPDAEAVQRALAERYETLTGDLERVGDKVEMGVTVLASGEPMETSPPNDVSGLGPGARYLYARAHRAGSEAEALNTLVRTELGAHAIDARCELHPRRPILFRGAFLLAPGDADRFQRAFRRLRRSHPELRCLLTGPWPPYTFVT